MTKTYTVNSTSPTSMEFTVDEQYTTDDFEQVASIYRSSFTFKSLWEIKEDTETYVRKMKSISPDYERFEAKHEHVSRDVFRFYHLFNARSF